MKRYVPYYSLSPGGRGPGRGGNALPHSTGMNSLARQLRKGSTEAERALWQQLRAARFEGRKFRRQVPIGRYVVDFVCFEARLIVELDGGQHAARQPYDAQRTTWLESQGSGAEVLEYGGVGQCGGGEGGDCAGVCGESPAWNLEWTDMGRLRRRVRGIPPLPNPPPRRGEGTRGGNLSHARGVTPSPLEGEGWGEGESAGARF